MLSPTSSSLTSNQNHKQQSPTDLTPLHQWQPKCILCMWFPLLPFFFSFFSSFNFLSIFCFWLRSSLMFFWICFTFQSLSPLSFVFFFFFIYLNTHFHFSSFLISFLIICLRSCVLSILVHCGWSPCDLLFLLTMLLRINSCLVGMLILVLLCHACLGA